MLSLRFNVNRFSNPLIFFTVGSWNTGVDEVSESQDGAVDVELSEA